MEEGRIDTSEAVLVGRGRALTAVAMSLAVLASAALVTIVLLGLEYDFDDGIFEPFEPVYPALLLLGLAIAGAVLLLAGRPWVRWIVAGGLAVGSAWVLVKADFGDRNLLAAMTVAAVWGVSALLITVPRSVAVYLERRAGSFERLLGPLDDEAAARHWLAAAAEWEGAGILSNRERRHLGEQLVAWSSSSSSVPGDLQQAIAPFVPPAHEPRLRGILRRFRRRQTADEDGTPST